MREVGLAIHGLRVTVVGDWAEVVDAVVADFAWFLSPVQTGEPSGIRVEIVRGAPDYDALGDGTASFVTPRNVVYQTAERTIVDYFGKALSVLDRSSGVLTITGETAHLVHEAGHQFLLSRIGEHLDRIGLVRLHGLGLSAAGGAIVVMLPSGGGKSTLALRALEADNVRVLAEDTPLIDRRGTVHPFPLRIGINETDADRLPPASVRRIEWMEFHPKLALDLESFRHRIDPVPRPLATSLSAVAR